MNYKFSNEPESINQPLSTITAVNSHYFVAPVMTAIGQTGFSSDRSYGMDEPVRTIVSKAEQCLVAPTLIQYHSETAKNEVRGQAIDAPIMTVDSSPRYALVSAFISKYYDGTYKGAGSELTEPVHTVTGKDHNALVTAFVSKFYKTGVGQGMDEPLHTVTTSAGHFAEVQAFLIKYYGQGTGQRADSPLDTVVSKDRFGLVQLKVIKIGSDAHYGKWSQVREFLNKYCDYGLQDDEILIFCICGENYIISDIAMRMLQPHELYAAQGFPLDYIIDHDYLGNSYPKSKQVARCGNAVPPPFAKAIVAANLPELCMKSCRDMAELNNVVAV